MREIVLDTETTGFEPSEGDRLVEIGAVELLNQMPTGRTYHQYINPERSMPAEAFAIHGLGDDFLRDQPLFSKVVDDFLTFIEGGRLVIHNAAFDMKFLNAELGLIKRPPLPTDTVIDTLMIARRRFPGSPASLDALCRRFGIDGFNRDLHGALLDSQILAEVYLELMGGRQPDLVLAPQSSAKGTTQDGASWRPHKRPTPLPTRLTAQEREAHTEFVEKLGDAAIWGNYDA